MSAANRKEILAWHFLAADRKFGYDDGNVAEVGYVYSVKPPIKMCKWGLHGSVKIHDALEYAPGPILGRVRLSGKIITDTDKLCATHREYLWIGDATEVLREHARWCALQVIEMWDAPDIVRRYLESGDESLRNSARDAAQADARAAAWGDEQDAARDAARDAAWGAARGTARGTAQDAAWAAAWDAARDAAQDTAWAAAWAAARDAARAEQKTDLESRIFALMPSSYR